MMLTQLRKEQGYLQSFSELNNRIINYIFKMDFNANYCFGFSHSRFCPPLENWPHSSENGTNPN